MTARQLQILLANGAGAGWLVFGLVFLLHRRPRRARARARDRGAWLGLAIQGLAFGVVWAVRRPWPAPDAPVTAREVVPAAVAAVLMAASILFTGAAVRALGKQWSLAAQVVEAHELVTTGPYAWVRNPIYTGMGGMLLATGLAVTTWLPLAAALVVYLLGTWLRVRLEERLLRDAFGAGFDDYARRVPALLPRWPATRPSGPGPPG